MAVTTASRLRVSEKRSAAPRVLCSFDCLRAGLLDELFGELDEVELTLGIGGVEMVGNGLWRRCVYTDSLLGVEHFRRSACQ
jgi:hypothetical protein